MQQHGRRQPESGHVEKRKPEKLRSQGCSSCRSGSRGMFLIIFIPYILTLCQSLVGSTNVFVDESRKLNITTSAI